MDRRVNPCIQASAFDAVLFDCDGVLVDSEAITCGVLHDFFARRNTRLEAEVQAMPHTHATVAHLHQRLQGRIACASGADRHKVELMLARVGLKPHFDGRIFSGHETPRSKPFPDVYLAAAAPWVDMPNVGTW